VKSLLGPFLFEDLFSHHDDLAIRLGKISDDLVFEIGKNFKDAVECPAVSGRLWKPDSTLFEVFKNLRKLVF